MSNLIISMCVLGCFCLSKRHEELFSYAGWACLRLDFCSLLDGEEVRIAVIDAWSIVLNTRDIGRAFPSPCRFFVSASTTVSLLHFYVFIVVR